MPRGRYKRSSEWENMSHYRMPWIWPWIWQNKSILPDLVFDRDMEVNCINEVKREVVTLDKTSPTLTLDLFKLPRELRDHVYGCILGPVKGPECREQLRFGVIGVARRVSESTSIAKHEAITDPTKVDSGLINFDTSSEYVPTISDRDEFLKYIPRSDYYLLESCAQRIRGMDEKPKETLDEFLQYFFDNTILDLRDEVEIIAEFERKKKSFHRGKESPHKRKRLCGRRKRSGRKEERSAREEKRSSLPDSSIQFILTPSHYWLKGRRDLHPYIRHVSLDLDTHSDMNNYHAFVNLCHCISRTLTLSSLTLWLSNDRGPNSDKEVFSGGDPPSDWASFINAVRKLVVRKSFEVHVFEAEYGGDAERRDSVRGKQIMADRKVLEKLMYDLLLPDTLRNPVQDDEYMGISGLFEEGEVEGKASRKRKRDFSDE